MTSRSVADRAATIVFSALLALAAPMIVSTTLAGPLKRDRDPVVLEGRDVPRLRGLPPHRIIGFRYEDGWTQIPVQVDERAVVDFGTIYNAAPMGSEILTYTDPDTFTGPDPDPSFDEDDELVFMASDSGSLRPSGSFPNDVAEGSGVEVAITDPLNDKQAFVYLFESTGGLDPSAGADRVSYQFQLLAGPYKDAYRTIEGPNPENSSAHSSAYRVHFSDRWIRDQTSVRVAGSPDTDILDGAKSQFFPGECIRSERTFSDGEGAFIVNKDGSIRALRGYVGANSGPTTYRVHRFYEAREDVFTSLRVHPIPSVMDYFDYSPAAVGMTYRNDLNTDGVIIDGQQDEVVPGQITWEMVTGPQGTLAFTHIFVTDIPDLGHTSYYSDLEDATAQQCSGDQSEYGASGPWMDSELPNTDPRQGDYFVLEATRIIEYGAPDRPPSFAERAARHALNPLVTRVSRLEDCPDRDQDGLAVCDGSCELPAGVICGDCNDRDPECLSDCGSCGGSRIGQSLAVVGDIDGNLASELAVLRQDPLTGHTRVHVTDALTGERLRKFLVYGASYRPRGLVRLSDFNGNGTDEIAVAARHEGNGMVLVRVIDAANGQLLNELRFSSNYHPRRLAAVRSFDGTGADEIALLGVHVGKGKILARIKDAASGAKLSDVFYPSRHQPVTMSVVPDFAQTEADEIAVLGVDPDTGRILATIKDAASAAKLGELYFSASYPARDMISVSSFAGSEADELAVLGVQAGTSLVLVRIKDALSGELLNDLLYSKAYAPAGCLEVPDFDGSVAPELAVVGIHANRDDVLVRNKDVDSGAKLSDVWYWDAFTPEAAAIVPDVGDGPADEIAILGVHPTTGDMIVQVRDASTGAAISTASIP